MGMRGWFGAIAIAVTLVAGVPPAAQATLRFETYLMDMGAAQISPVLADFDRDGRSDLVHGHKIALRRTDGSIDNPFVWGTTPGGQYVAGGGVMTGDASPDLITWENPSTDS